MPCAGSCRRLDRSRASAADMSTTAVSTAAPCCARRRSASNAWTSSCGSMETAIPVRTISPAAMMISRASRVSDPKIGSGVYKMAEYIEREAALEICENEYQKRLRMLDYRGDTVAWNIGSEIKSLPAADVAPVVHGRWIEKSAPARKIYFECSHCGAQENKHTAIKGYYCWRCGARMDGDSDAKAD